MAVSTNSSNNSVAFLSDVPDHEFSVDQLLQRSPDGVVQRIEVWTVWWPVAWLDEVWHVCLQVGHSVF